MCAIATREILTPSGSPSSVHRNNQHHTVDPGEMCNWHEQEIETPILRIRIVLQNNTISDTVPKTTVLPNLPAVSDDDREDEGTVLREYPTSAIIQQRCRLVFPSAGPLALRSQDATQAAWGLGPLGWWSRI